MKDKHTKKPVNAAPQIGSTNEPLLPGQKPGVDPKGADKFAVHPKSVVWHDPKLQKAWEALHVGDEDE